MAAEVGFARAGELPGELAGARIGAKQVERAAETLGREIAADERAVSLEGFRNPRPLPRPAPVVIRIPDSLFVAVADIAGQLAAVDCRLDPFEVEVHGPGFRPVLGVDNPGGVEIGLQSDLAGDSLRAEIAEETAAEAVARRAAETPG